MKMAKNWQPLGIVLVILLGFFLIVAISFYNVGKEEGKASAVPFYFEGNQEVSHFKFNGYINFKVNDDSIIIEIVNED